MLAVTIEWVQINKGEKLDKKDDQWIEAPELDELKGLSDRDIVTSAWAIPGSIPACVIIMIVVHAPPPSDAEVCSRVL